LIYLVALLFATITIFHPSPGDTSVWGQAYLDEAVCIKVNDGAMTCTIANESGFFGVFPLEPLQVGDELVAWGTYSEVSKMTIAYRFFLPVVKNE